MIGHPLRAAVRRPTSPKGGGKRKAALSQLNDHLLPQFLPQADGFGDIPCFGFFQKILQIRPCSP